jgi:hypothetical protein
MPLARSAGEGDIGEEIFRDLHDASFDTLKVDDFM